MARIKSVLFVCTGNSCRSIMAEGLLRKALKEIGREDIEVVSAGISAFNGSSPTEETVTVMRREGVDVSAFKSKSLTDEMIKKADLILTMAAHHMDEVIRRVPAASLKTHLLKQFGIDSDTMTCEELDVRDPIGRPIDEYERVLASIKKEIKRIINLI